MHPPKNILQDAENEQLDDHSKLFLQKVRDFARTEVAPNTDKWEAEEDLPKSIFESAAKIGLLGMNAPKEFGGQAFSMLTSALAIVELAKYDAALALDIAAANALGLGHLLAFGTDAQKQKYAPRMISGEYLSAWALTEPNAGSDTAAMQTHAEKNAHGQWILNGHKKFITQGRKADVLVVMAVSGKNAQGKSEISAFLVEKSQVKPIRKIPTYGVRASETSEIKFENAHAELLGNEPAHGQAQALAILDRGRIGVTAVATGIAIAAFEAGLKYAMERKQFGKTLAELQSIQNLLADSAVELAAAEGLLLRAADLQARGFPTTKESAMAKLYSSEAGTRICNRSMQIHGGVGYSRDFPVERYLRDVKLCEIGEGTSEVQRIVIARQLVQQQKAEQT